MNYKIPFGGCSCGCGTSGNTAGAGNGVAVVGNQARTYKLLNNDDKSVSLQENMVAELDTISLKKTSSDVQESLGGSTRLVAATHMIGEGNYLYLRYLKESQHPFAYFFGCILHDYVPTNNGPRPEGYPNFYSYYTDTIDDLLSDGCSAIDLWRTIADQTESITGGSYEHYNILFARTYNDSVTSYRLSNYLSDFPLMMNLDEILWYLSELHSAYQILGTQQYVLVPLTDRIHISDSETNPRIDSYVYIARFFIDENGNISYHDTCGCYMDGNSIGNLMDRSEYNYGENGESHKADFIFCQKKYNSSLFYDIPLNVPEDFNAGGKASIILHNHASCYLRFIAEGKVFIPYRGNDLIWESTINSYLMPIYNKRVGTIDFETIKRGNDDAILVSSFISYNTNSSGSDSSDGYISPGEDETDDILDINEVTAIYSSSGIHPLN